MRPRSARAHGDVLDAALKLFAERGIDATSMDAIAEQSGVSKATIYKHWRGKDALCLEVMLRAHGSPGPYADSGDLRTDLLAVLDRQPAGQPDNLVIRMMPHLIAYAARNPTFAKAWQMKVLEPPRAELARVLKRAAGRRDLPGSIDVDVAIALLLGPMMYGQLLRRVGKSAPKGLAERAVDAFLRAHAVTDRGAASPGTRRAYRRPPSHRDPPRPR